MRPAPLLGIAGLSTRTVHLSRGTMTLLDSDPEGVRGGGRRPVLFVHGFGRGSLQLAPLALVFRHSGRVLVPDLFDLGGRSASRAGSTDVLHHADSLDELCFSLGVDAVDVVGISFGGWVGAWLAIRAPERVARLFLVNPAGVRARSEELAELYRTADADDALYRRVVSGPPFVGVPLVSRILERAFMRTLTDPSIARFLETVDDEHFLDESLDRIRSETFLLLGAADELLDLRATAELFRARVPGVRGKWVEGGSHNLGYEAFEVLCEELAAFLGTGRLPARSRVLGLARHLKIPPKTFDLEAAP